MLSADQKVLEHARDNGGAITSGEARALGMSPTTLKRRVDSGWLVRVGKGTFVLAGVNDEWRAVLSAATRRLAAAVSHEAAAQLHRMRNVRPGVLVVSVPTRRTNRFPGVRVHQSTDLVDEHVKLYDGLRTTTPERTIVDLAAITSDSLLNRIVSFAVADSRIDLLRLQDMFESLARKGKPGVRRLRRILELVDVATPESELEVRFMEIVTRSSLPLPISQFSPPWLTKAEGRVDFAYPEAKLLVEVDGRRWHTDEMAFMKDRERDNLAQLAGWRTLRFTWTDITTRPTYVVLTISKALDAPF